MWIKHRGIMKPFLEKGKPALPTGEAKPERGKSAYTKVAVAIGLPEFRSAPAPSRAAGPRNARLPAVPSGEGAPSDPAGATAKRSGAASTDRLKLNFTYGPSLEEEFQSGLLGDSTSRTTLRPAESKPAKPAVGLSKSPLAMTHHPKATSGASSAPGALKAARHPSADLKLLDWKDPQAGPQLMEFVRTVDDESFDLRFGLQNRDRLVAQGHEEFATHIDSVIPVRVDGKMVGFADFQPCDDYAPGQVARVGVIVDKAHQGKRLGEQALMAAAREVTAAGYTHFLAYVKRENTAQVGRMESARMQALGAKELPDAGRLRTYLVPTKPEYRDLEPRRANGRESPSRSAESLAIDPDDLDLDNLDVEELQDRVDNDDYDNTNIW